MIAEPISEVTGDRETDLSRDIRLLSCTVKMEEERLQNMRDASEAIAVEVGILSLTLNDHRQRLKWALEAKAAGVQG